MSKMGDPHKPRSLSVPDGLALTTAWLYALILCRLLFLRQEAFNTFALDLGKFDQAIWNTAQGRWFHTSLGEGSVLISHFSPALALFAPLYWLWPDIRLLSILLVLFVATAGLILYRQHRQNQQPWLGLTLMGAFLMHPTVHQVTLVGFRRESLVILTASVALYSLLNRRHTTLLLALILTLLCKEDMAFFVGGVGVHLVISKQHRSLGAALISLAVGYVILIPNWILPALSGQSSYGFTAPVLGHLGNTPGEIVATLVTHPDIALRQACQPDRLVALAMFFGPTLGLCVLGWDIVLLMTPFLAYQLLSGIPAMGRLEDWYPTLTMIILYWATSKGLVRVHLTWRPTAQVMLLMGSCLGWWLHSPLWPGPRWGPSLYAVSDHDRAAVAALEAIPPDAVVGAQDGFVPHLTHRAEIRILPAVPEDLPLDYVVIDRDGSIYPFSPDEHRAYLYRWLSDPNIAISRQVDDLFVLAIQQSAHPEIARSDHWENGLSLEGLTVVLANTDGGFVDTRRIDPHRLRVELYWRTSQATAVNYSEFVHLIAEDGFLVAQSDGWPADGLRPTSMEPAGTSFRSIHYLTWSGRGTLGLRLRIGWYPDTLTRVRVNDHLDSIVIRLTPKGHDAAR